MCAFVCKKEREIEREKFPGVCVCVCACTRIGVCNTCCDSRHHADFISVISACQPGALGTSVELFYILLSALNVFCFFSFLFFKSVF